jgi:hypothetical protein
MHLLPAYYTTTRIKKRKSSKSKKLAEATAKHEAWVLSMTKGKKADKKILDFKFKERYNEYMKVDQSDYVSSGLSGDASSCIKRGVMANLHKESSEVQKQILDKASRVMPLFNKGGLQYATPETDLTTVGSKSRRG